MPEQQETQNQPEQHAQEAQQPEQQQDTSQLPQWARDAISKANREAANYRTQVNELKPLADQFRQLDEASKSEMQRLQESLDAAARDRDARAADALRYQVAIDHGIGKDYLDLLGTGSQDELAARAQRLADLQAQAAAAATTAAAPATPPTQRTVQDLRPGATPSDPPVGEKDALYAQLFGADTNLQ